MHAVSVGEILAAIPLLREIRKARPHVPVFVSTSTLAGRETAEKRLVEVAAGVFYGPLDYVWCVRRVLRRLRPSVVVILETEIWPNLFRESKRVGCGLVLVNGRISDRALPRYRKFASLFGPVLEHCDRVLVQSEEMKSRFVEAGAPADRIEPAGNLKYDFAPGVLAEDSPVRRFLETDHGRHLWIAASTSADDRIEEENFVIDAQKQLAGWRLILAPRKPERFDRVAALMQGSGLSWTRRSDLRNPSADVLLLDSIGELSAVFGFADVVFMGGTLADRGGHNILEPALFGKPVIAGPHLENFRDIEAHFERVRAVRRIASGDQLPAAVTEVAGDKGLGERGRQAAEAERGASARTAAEVLALYAVTYPCQRGPQPGYALLAMMATGWRYAGARDRRRKTARARRLPKPVVSVGNITTGGTGKTPLTIELLRASQGRQAAMLSRGHGRASHENVLFLPGDLVPSLITGDEPQLCMRAVPVPMGIGSDRYAVGMELLSAVDAGMFVLDDGFQHLQLERDFDLVAVDALRPFGGRHLLPLGRLREPLEGLGRADAFVITRADEVQNTDVVENVLRRYNASAPVFRARTRPCCWHSATGERLDLEPLPMQGEKAVAFCGLGNPQAFWRTLRQLGLEPRACYDFDDHHRYSPGEIRRLVRHARDLQAGVLLTTAKDAVNLEPGYLEILQEIKLYWLEIRMEIERGEELFRLIDQRL